MVFTSERQVQLEDFTLDAALGPREALVRGKYSVISPGTEGASYSGLVQQMATMREHRPAGDPRTGTVSPADRLRALGRSAGRRQRRRGRAGRRYGHELCQPRLPRQSGHRPLLPAGPRRPGPRRPARRLRADGRRRHHGRPQRQRLPRRQGTGRRLGPGRQLRRAALPARWRRGARQRSDRRAPCHRRPVRHYADREPR